MKLSLLSTLILLLNLTPCYAQPSETFDHLIDNGGFIVKDGSGHLQYRERETFIPASTLKIVTCLAALEILGEDYRFETHFFLDDKKNLYIKGFGDPFLTSEVLSDIAEKLYSQGIRQLSSIILDDTSYTLDSLADGAAHSPNPFDAPNGALAVNFNSVPVSITPDGTITSGELQTPNIPVIYDIGNNLPPGLHRININILPKEKSLTPSLRYAGELITELFHTAGIVIHKKFQAGPTPSSLRIVYIHKSEKKVRDMVRACMKYSNNYLANQLFLACGAVSYGYPASWEKSRRLFRSYAKERLGLSSREFHLTEGSGLSRKNRITPAGLLTAVELFQPYMHLLNHEGDIYIKSGSLRDVFSYAGFFVHRARLLPFVIMLNQKENNRLKLLTALQHAIVSESGNVRSF